ncbi:benzoate/H(+) symporter BenE family transporter, partial [Achromobacter xylosoxidans]
LAGVLLNFGMGIFTNVGKQPALVLAMCAAYLVCRRWAPRYAVLVVMAVAVAMAAGLGLIQVDQLDWHLTEFVWTTPVFSMQAAVSLGVPLF